MRIIGISGTNGSGKDTVMRLLSDKYGYMFVSGTELLIVELIKRKWPKDRMHKSKLSAEWRRELGMGVIVDKAVELFNNKSSHQFRGVVIGSLRHPGEAERVHELGGKVIWIDADPKVRYRRIQDNLNERVGTHDEAGKTFDQFIDEEKREMHPSGDEATLNMSGVKDLADVYIDNNFSDVDTFKNYLEKKLKEYL